MGIERVWRGDGSVVATWHGVMIYVGRGAHDYEHVELLHQTLANLHEAHPDGVALLLWLHADSKAPDMRARVRAGKMFKEMGPHIRAMGLVVESTGFVASIFQSIVAGFALVARLKLKTFPDVREASSWIGDRMGSPVRGEALLDVVRTLDQELRTDPP